MQAATHSTYHIFYSRPTSQETGTFFCVCMVFFVLACKFLCHLMGAGPVFGRACSEVGIKQGFKVEELPVLRFSCLLPVSREKRILNPL